MKRISLLCALIFTFLLNAQSSKWTDLFSYNNVLAIKESRGRIAVASTNGLFFYDPARGEITKLSKANGLHEVKISTFDYNTETHTGLIGYESGNLEVITPSESYYIVDIPLSQGFSGNRRINHIYISGDIALVSGNYGVSIFNLKTREFGDTVFFSKGGTFLPALESVILENTVYVATSEGLKSHPVNVSFPVYSEWDTEPDGIMDIDASDKLVVANQTSVKIGKPGSWQYLTGNFSSIQDVEITAEGVVVTDQQSVFVFDVNSQLQNTYDFGQELNTSHIINGKLYTGSRYSGVVDSDKTILKPDGPFSNISYKLSLHEGKILVSTGSREERYNYPARPVLDLGIYFFDGSQWVYPSFFINNAISFNTLDAVFNPSNPNEILFNNYLFSVDQGIYKMRYEAARKDFDLVKFYSSTKTDVYHNRPVGLLFDDQNNLFGTHAFHDGEGYAGYHYYQKAKDDFIFLPLKIGQAAEKPISYEGLLWMPLSRGSELVAVDYKNPETAADDVLYRVGRSAGLPAAANSVLSLTFDHSGDAWIGTNAGLRVLPSAASAIKSSPKALPVVIQQGGIAEELFKDLSILQIAVDAGNQKWVSVDGGGVFYLNSTGEKTLLNFNKENSSLPSNSVTDIKIDEKTGKVYFASYDGIVVFQGDVAEINSKFSDVLVYPNPVILAQHKNGVTIKGLAEKTNLRITDVAGNLVHLAISRGGFYNWDLKNTKGREVATGIYFVLMTNGDGTDKATAKIAVIR